MKEKIIKFVRTTGLPRIIIALFMFALFVLAYLTKMSLSILISDSLVRVARNGILVLALVPPIQAGVGLNFGLPLGVICGLLGILIIMEFQLVGWTGFLASIAFSLPIALIAGYLYALLLNKVQGQEMMVGTYVGFSIVSGMSIFWILAPFRNPEMIWPIGGKGLRTTLNLGNYFARLLDNLGRFQIFKVNIPTGLIGFFLLFCLLVWAFFRTKFGITMRTAGRNPRFALSAGIDVIKMRIWAVILSTILAAIGTIAFSSSLGFPQLYLAPLMMAFPAIASILIGGATARNANIFHVIVGTALFHTLLTIALPVTSQIVHADLSEIARVIISNGMILYALTKELRR